MKMMKFKSFGLLLIFVATSLWLGCSEDPIRPIIPDPVEMTVTVWPADNSINIDYNVKPTLKFSHELNGDMPQASVVRESNGLTINQNLVKVSSTLYRVEFLAPLEEEETYTLYLHEAIGKNGEILPPPVPLTSCFTTHDTVIIAPPLVLSAVSPLQGEEIPHTSMTLTYTADYELDPPTVVSAYSLNETSGLPKRNLSIEVNGKDIIVNVAGILEHSSEYTAEFDADIIRGLNGEKPVTTYSFSFTTEVVIPQPVFTTPEGFNQLAGTNKDGIYYIAGYGSDYEGFIASFNWEGDSLWLHSFKIDGKSSNVLGVATTDQHLFSFVSVKTDPHDPIPGQIWIYMLSLTGEYQNKWQVVNRGTAYDIVSSSTDAYISYTNETTHFVQRYNESGLQTEISFGNKGVRGLLYDSGYIYISGGALQGGALFLSKWYASLSDSLWYREKLDPNIRGGIGGRVAYASDRLWLIGHEIEEVTFSMRLVLRQYDLEGALLDESIYPNFVHVAKDVCSDNSSIYIVGSMGFSRIDLSGNIQQLAQVEGFNVFRADDPNGSNHKIGVTDNINELFLYNR